jgi:small subunit ribosomal protein S21
MLVVQVKDSEGVEKAIKILKKKLEKTKLINELRRRQAYIKPSITRKEIIKRAKRKQQLLKQEE